MYYKSPTEFSHSQDQWPSRFRARSACLGSVNFLQFAKIPKWVPLMPHRTCIGSLIIDTLNVAYRLGPIVNEDEDYLTDSMSSSSNTTRQWSDWTKCIWVFFALTSVGLQTTRVVELSSEHLRILECVELTLTFLFDIKIIRWLPAHLPRWWTSFDHGNNWLDLLLHRQFDHSNFGD